MKMSANNKATKEDGNSTGDEEGATSSGTITVDERLCKACGYCVYICPKEVLVLSNSPFSRGYNVVQIMHPENCIKCRKCEYNCPEMAIFLEEEGETT